MFYMHLSVANDSHIEWGPDKRKVLDPAVCDLLWSGEVSTSVLALQVDHNL
jgi:hypothetical protein